MELILRDAAYEFYMKYEQEFSSFQQNLNDLKFVHGDFLEYYNYILSIQEENEGT